MTVLCTADLDLPSFIGIIKDNPLLPSPFSMIFSPAEAKLDLFHFDETLFSESMQGRLFSPEGELRWRRIDGYMRTVYLGVGPAFELFEDCSDELTGLKRQIEEHFLWGKYYDPTEEWIEQQVPHRFKYPLEGGRHPNGRVKLLTEAWSDVTDQTMFQRYYDLKETPGE